MSACTFRPDHSWNDHGVCLICGALQPYDVLTHEYPPTPEIASAVTKALLARARTASEAVTIQALRDEIGVLRAELAKEKASNPGRYIPESQIIYPQLEEDGA